MNKHQDRDSTEPDNAEIISSDEATENLSRKILGGSGSRMPGPMMFSKLLQRVY